MNLKTFVSFSLALGLGASTAVAQKANVVTAYNYNKAFERDKECSDIEKGVEAIEEAVKDEKTGSWAKTWYYGGNLYFNAALNKDEECKAKFPEAIDKTMEFYLNALKYNIEDEASNDLDLENPEDQQKFMGFIMNRKTSYDDPTYTRDILGNKFPYMANALLNLGVEAFQNNEFEKAKALYEKSIMTNAIMGRVDSLGMFNAALVSERLEKYDEALEYYTALSQINYGGPDVYLYMASIYDRKEDTTKKIEVIRRGLEKYPDNEGLVREELSYLLTTGQIDQALENFDKAIAKDPEDATLYYNRGLIYDQMGEFEKAESDYKKAIEADPKFFDAAYNLGAMYYNAGAEWNNKASNFGMDQQAEYEEATKKANEYFSKAKPALEKAHEMNPSDKNTMASLVQVYAIMGENEKYKAMKAKLQGE
ncbi:MAG: tetratricopeptide repeat protein [Vicingaceae bacterium]